MAMIAILMGSKSDAATMAACEDTLRELGITYETRVMSAHRTPEQVREYAVGAKDNGVQVIICAAGMAAHLAGVVASHTDLPVIGVPMPGGIGDGLDALLSTVQMPGGVPVAAMAVGKAGAKNAAILAARIIALRDSAVASALVKWRRKMVEEVIAADASLADRK